MGKTIEITGAALGKTLDLLKQGETFTAKESGRQYESVTLQLPDGTRLWVKREVKAYSAEAKEIKAAEVAARVAPTVRTRGLASAGAHAAAAKAPSMEEIIAKAVAAAMASVK